MTAHNLSFPAEAPHACDERFSPESKKIARKWVSSCIYESNKTKPGQRPPWRCTWTTDGPMTCGCQFNCVKDGYQEFGYVKGKTQPGSVFLWDWLLPPKSKIPFTEMQPPKNTYITSNLAKRVCALPEIQRTISRPWRGFSRDLWATQAHEHNRPWACFDNSHTATHTNTAVLL